MADIIQLRRGTAAEWTAANTVLASGEAGLETDTNKLKFGDGVTAWNSLAYFGGSGAGYPQHTLQQNTTVQSYESYIVVGPLSLNGFVLTNYGRVKAD